MDTEEYRASRRAAYEAIRAKHPDLITVGFDCNGGWLPILNRYFDDVAEALDDAPSVSYELWQVKEKLGRLAIYSVLDSPTRDDEVRRRIGDAHERAMKEAKHTCDVCGGDGVLRVSEGWFATRCVAHADGGVPYRPQGEDE